MQIKVKTTGFSLETTSTLGSLFESHRQGAVDYLDGTMGSAWPFVAFAVVFAAAVYAHFLLAYRAWRLSRGEQATDIDPNYVRLEN